jgi:hypothetical protein
VETKISEIREFSKFSSLTFRKHKPLEIILLTSAKGHVHKAVTDDGQLAVKERVLDKLAVQVFVPRVIRVDSHGRVTKHGL